jgi:hypothetical protein
MSYNDLINKLQEQVNSFTSYTNEKKITNSINSTNTIQKYVTEPQQKYNFFNNINKDSYIKIGKYASIILGPILLIVLCFLYIKPKFIYKDEITLKNAKISWNNNTPTKISYKKLSKATLYTYVIITIIACICYFYYTKKYKS